MPQEQIVELSLPDEGATARLGEDIAAALRPGDLLTLRGGLGAGKTTLARSLIRSLAGDPQLEVPSPTFTLLQSYEARIPVHHLDLYRLSGAEELDELGLDELLTGGVALVEWPERAGPRLGPDVVEISFKEAEPGRTARISGGAAPVGRIARSLAIRTFLEQAGWGDARREHLLGDASARAYETVRRPGVPVRIVMNAPKLPDGPPIRQGKPYSRIAHLAESVVPFVAVARGLKQRGFAAPEIFAEDLEQGFLLLEHLGVEGFLDIAGNPVPERYEAAAELLASVHAQAWPRELPVGPDFYRLPDYDDEALLIETELIPDWYLPWATGKPATEVQRRQFTAAWRQILRVLDSAERSIVLRDYHSPNLIWRARQEGVSRVGILDFQDAVIGPSAYDLASLAQDARVTIPPQLEEATISAYVRLRNRDEAFDEERFRASYAIMAAQRNSKILGIFVRLDRRDGKPHYLRHLPRIRGYLNRALAHPALAPVRDVYLSLGILGEENA